MAALLVRHFPKLSSRIQSFQQRLISSRAVVNPISKRMVVTGGYIATVPRRYFTKNPMSISNMPSDDTALVRWRQARRKAQRVLTKVYVQVYSVQILSDELDQVYGTIAIKGRRPSLFRRQFGQDGNHRHDIDPHGFVRLSGLDSPVWSDDYNDIALKLYRGNHPGDFYHPARGMCMNIIPQEDAGILDRSGIYGVSITTPWDFGRNLPNRLLIQEIKTTCGTVRLAYAGFTDSAEYHVTIKLLEWRGEGDGANVYGRIYAFNTQIDNELAKSLVFDRNRDEETLFIMPGHYIPLQAPDNITSMGHTLELTLSIFHKYTDSSNDFNDIELLRETFSVETKCYTDEETSIDGICDRVQFNGKLATFEVQIYWLPTWSWPATKSYYD